MRPIAVTFALGAFGCAEPAIELELRLPPSSSIPESFDLKCVSAIDVVALPENAEESDIGQQFFYDRKRPPCVELDRAPENFTDIRNAMRGQIELPIPVEGLLGIQVRGRIGTCDDEPLYHEAIFYGGATYNDRDTITVPLVANISCNTRRDYEVRPVDLLALTATKACPAPISEGIVFAGNIRPTLLTPKLEPLMFEAGSSFLKPMNGTSTISSYSNMTTSSCVAAAYELDTEIGVTCINATAATVCGEPNEIELPTLPGPFLAESTDGSLAAQFGPPTFIGVWETLPAKLPLTGATVTLPEPEHGEVVYLDTTSTRFTPRAGSTGPNGMFAVYADRVMEITVSAPGHTARKLLVGGTPQLFGTGIAVLPRI